MKAAVRDRYGGPDVVRIVDVDPPQVREDQVLIRVRAAGVNRSDWEALTARPAYVRLSGNGLVKPKHARLGTDVAGVVEAVGNEVSRFEVGDEVFGDMLWEGSGTFGEYVAVREAAPLVRKPPNVGFAEAAALPQAAGLAWQACTERAPAVEGARVLVNGAGGGAGTFALQIAQHLGAHVSGVDRSEKLDTMRQAGADVVIDFAREDPTRDREPFGLIVDFAGRRSILPFRRMLVDGGAYVMVGGTMPRVLQVVTVGSLVSRTSAKTMRLLMAKPNQNDLTHLGLMVERGELRPMIERTYPLDELSEALRHFGTDMTKGKLVITM